MPFTADNENQFVCPGCLRWEDLELDRFIDPDD
jgi:hypothetical protein